MTQEEYYQYLAKTFALEDGSMPSNRDYTDRLYGFFQHFMPDGAGVDKVFEPLPGKNEYLQRIRGIFDTTRNTVAQTMSEGKTPAYFVPEKAGISNEALIQTGKNFITALRVFAQHIEHDEMLEVLNSTKNIRVVVEEIRSSEIEEHELVDEAIFEWTQDQCDHDEPVEILSEAYYSIACDYWIAYYLQYPRYADKPEVDFLEPYFELWKAGYHCWFYPGELRISHV